MSATLRRLTALGPWRGLFVIAMLVLAAFSGHPSGGVMSGALDRVFFDVMATLVARPSTGRVAIVNIDAATVAQLDLRQIADTSEQLLDRLGDAASVVIDLPLSRALDNSSLEAGMRVRRNTLLVPPANASDPAGNPVLMLPPTAVTLAAALSQREVYVGHYGVVTGFVPYVASASGPRAHVALDALRVAGITPPLRIDAFTQPYALSVGGGQTQAVVTMLPRRVGLPQYSYLDVIRGRVPKSAFAGKVVFVGNLAWRGEGAYQVSSLDSHEVSRAQLDALLTDAVVAGNLAREVSSAVEVVVYIALALGIVLICLFVPGRAMHVAAIGWGVLIFAVPLVLLAFHMFLPLGLLPFVCLLIYVFFAWDRHSRTLALLRRELSEWRAIAASIQPKHRMSTPAALALAPDGDLAEIKAALRQVRGWQTLYVDMINQLPYPVFLAMDGHVAVWNAKAAALMNADAAAEATPGTTQALAQVEQFVAESVLKGGDISHEIEWGGRAHMLVCEPLSSESEGANGVAQRSHLVCLIDIADVKDLVSQDKRMLRHIAHDLRSPLTAILSLIDRRGATHNDNVVTPTDREFLSDLRQQAAYSLRIAKDFMQLSRAERLDRAEFEPVALSEVAEEAIDQSWLAADQKGIVLHEPVFSVDDTIVDGNADMLMRALVNVVDNAIKYSPSGTTVSVAIDATSDGALVLSVTDQGIGMTDETVHRLFEPFFQAERKPDGSGGVGLGLPFVKTVIERHGGTIDVRSRPGHGTVFALILPRTLKD
ncbi:ATP-binding protein [Ralstonia flaminis]|jgi:signal transduction histidine kinase/CHASE2 domain-containing sensor protein|uniref:histidine kinase n=1 Tax=Ralstonia flaminis TaxID=3058597 RepID=A0ABM9KBM5_9RALS|nr:ATP-binding protein [Ralstonia sp. LMG 18101]CAJ0822189.1 Adaptive-response sensory-kinase SasA [Ralstonia sp. LMG 18101]